MSELRLLETNPASDWCQRWDAGRHSFRHTSEGGFDPKRYAIEPISEAVAKDFVVTNHYSGSYPAAVLRYGLLDTYNDNDLLGVAVLSAPVQTKALTNVFPDLDPFAESLELGRFVLVDSDAAPANSEVFFLARVFDQAAAAGVRGIVSFADPVPRLRADGTVLTPGHVGTIYKAHNGVYLGRGTARTLTMLPDGSVLNDRSAQKVRRQERGHDHVEAKLVRLGAPVMRAGQQPAAWLNAALNQLDARKVRHNGNHRYCWAIGTKTQRRHTVITGDRQPYPQKEAA